MGRRFRGWGGGSPSQLQGGNGEKRNGWGERDMTLGHGRKEIT
nr:MAG TPA: hypothetical protein [Caudoviricetes sp.]